MAAGDGLVVARAQPILPAPGDEGEARRRAHWGVRVTVGEAEPLRGETVQLGRARRPTAVAAEIRVPEIVGQDEDEARPRPPPAHRSRSISMRRRILPDADFGIWSMNSGRGRSFATPRRA